MGLDRRASSARPASSKDRTAQSFAKALASLKLRDMTGVRVVFAWLERFGVPLRDRADLAQEVLLRAFIAWPRYDPTPYIIPPTGARLRGSSPSFDRQTFGRWLNQITRNIATNHLLSARRRPEVLHPDPLGEDVVDTNTPAPDARLERRATRAELAAALRCLRPSWRRAAFGNISRLAARSGAPISTLYKVRERALDELATLLASDPINLWRARLAALAMARRVLTAHGLADADARALLRAAHRARYPVTMLWLCRRGVRLGLPPWSPGPLALAALASREAGVEHGDRARDLRQLAVDAAEMALTRLCRSLGQQGECRAGTE